MRNSYYFKLEVMGRGKFPLDQLRRFEMFPIDIETTQAIGYSFDSLDNSKPSANRTYTLGMNSLSMGGDQPCIDRFASFGFAAVTLEVWRPDGTLFAARPEADCSHSAYTLFGSNNYPHPIDRGPFCPTCDDLVEL